MGKKRPTRVQDTVIFKVSLLSISLFLIMAPAVSPALPLMYKAFPGVDQAGVEILVTIPNLGIIIGLIISPFLIAAIGEKATVLAGLIGTLLTGTFPMYVSAYIPILISRLLIGVSIGLYNSLALSLIPRFYRDDKGELATMVGFQNVTGSLGAAIASFLISWLITISWHAAFAVFFLVIPVFIVFTLFVPLPKDKNQEQGSAQPKKKQHITSEIVLIAVLMFLFYLFYMPVSYKLPAFVIAEHLGSISNVSTLTGVFNLISIPIGASFGFFFKRLHDKLFPLGCATIALGFFITTFSVNFAMLIVGTLIIGIGFGSTTPYLYNWLDLAAPKDSVNLATTIVLIVVNIGCGISPMVINVMSSDPKQDLLISACFFALGTIYGLIHYFHVRKSTVNIII